MSDEKFPLPPPIMPSVISNALFGTTKPTDGDDEDAEDLASQALLERTMNIPSPWQRPPESAPAPRLRYIDEDEIEKEQYAEPVRKLFFPNESTSTTAPAEATGRFQFTKRTEPTAPTPDSLHDDNKELAVEARENAIREYITRSVGDEVFPTAEDLARYTEEVGAPEEAALIRKIAKSL